MLRTLMCGISRLTITLKAAVEADKNLEPSTMKWESIYRRKKHETIARLRVLAVVAVAQSVVWS